MFVTMFRTHQRPIALFSNTLPHCSESDKVVARQKRDTEVTSHEMFEARAEKNKQTFKDAIEIFNGRDIRKRGQVEFIRVSYEVSLYR